MMKNNKGFTLVELLVVVLIIGILAAMAMPAYFKAVERSRAAEADTLIGSVVNAQARYKMKTGNYATSWKSLDIAPKGAGNTNIYCTKGTQPASGKDGAYAATTFSATVCGTGNGFAIELIGTNTKDSNKSGVIAHRVGSGQYTYKLFKKYDETGVIHCDAVSGQDNVDFCIEYTGNESYSEDPSSAVSAS